MTIAIASEGNNPQSNIDSRFGRCSYFAFYDTETKNTEFLLNPARDQSGGAGSSAVQFIAGKGAKKVIAGDFGGKIRTLLESLQIEVQNESGETIAEIIGKL